MIVINVNNVFLNIINRGQLILKNEQYIKNYISKKHFLNCFLLGSVFLINKNMF